MDKIECKNLLATSLSLEPKEILFSDNSTHGVFSVAQQIASSGIYKLPAGGDYHSLTLYVEADVTVILEELHEPTESYARSIKIVVAQGAHVTYRARAQLDETVKRYQLFTVEVGVRASFVKEAWYAGGAVQSTAYRCQLVGVGGSVSYTGRMHARGVEKHTVSFVQIHKAPDTTSTVELKTVADDNSVCVYEGTISIEKQAVRSQAHQEHKALLMSNTAQVRSVPNLEVLTHHVVCGHGSALAHIDDDHLFYLASRGIACNRAQQMIIDGFLST